jgi:hypothetical protein
VVVEPHAMALTDGRSAAPALMREGFVLVPHASRVSDFEDAAQVGAVHPAEIAALVKALTGADEVLVTAPGLLRFSEASGRAGSLDNSMPARFAHVDTSAETAAQFAQASLPAGRNIARHAHYNVWRAFSEPPQDVPLAVCDGRSVTEGDLMLADAVFDLPGRPEWGFDSYLLAHSPKHRWHWFADMHRDEALVFRTSDSLLGQPVPHVAFDNPLVPAGAPPRASIEMRCVAYWYG